MRYKLVKIGNLSGDEASIYSVYLFDLQKTLFDIFLEENFGENKKEVIDIHGRLKTIGNDTGARETYFKLKEGNPGDGVCALFDCPEKALRLYCIRYSTLIVIAGGGGLKPKEMRAFQESKKLELENYRLREISNDIKRRMSDNEILITDDGMDFEGDLEFKELENE